jgi:hypothetical protein
MRSNTSHRSSSRPGWVTYATAGILQACLLVMCLFWKRRQRRLGIDDFGRPLLDGINDQTIIGRPNDETSDESTPLLRT